MKISIATFRAKFGTLFFILKLNESIELDLNQNEASRVDESAQDDVSPEGDSNSSSVAHPSKSTKVDMKAKLERSRQSARECRARKKLRYQYLEDLVNKKERAVLALRHEIDLVILILN